MTFDYTVQGSAEGKAAPLRIVPLGGLGEVGKNMMCIECEGQILLIDCGVMFPENDMLGVDLVIPDWDYLRDRADQILGIVVTHGHEDHIGALPYLLEEFPMPVYATRLTLGLIEVKIRERHRESGSSLNLIRPGKPFELGPFEIEPYAVNHSIPDGVGLAIRTPVGLIVHSGDFKFDHTPVDGRATDLTRIAQLAGEDVLLLLADSTNSERAGFTPSEQVIDAAFDQAFREAPGRIITATFASLISRIQQVLWAAERHGRYVAIAGHLKIPEGLLVTPQELSQLPPRESLLLTTGTQGEPSAGLARLAMGKHRQVKLVPGDTVIVSAHPIPGNEEEINDIINRLFQRGANVIYERIAQVHVSGHASQEEQKLLMRLLKPRFFVPIHGELHHLHAHARLAQGLGMPKSNVFVLENGYPLELDGESASVRDRIPGGYVFVDGASVGDIGPEVLREREALARSGIVVAEVVVSARTGLLVQPPRLISKGFIPHDFAPEHLEEAAARIERSFEASPRPGERAMVENRIKDQLTQLFYSRVRRRPIIVPMVTEV
jgi:ribonuclease J